MHEDESKVDFKIPVWKTLKSGHPFLQDSYSYYDDVER